MTLRLKTEKNPRTLDWQKIDKWRWRGLPKKLFIPQWLLLPESCYSAVVSQIWDPGPQRATLIQKSLPYRITCRRLPLTMNFWMVQKFAIRDRRWNYTNTWYDRSTTYNTICDAMMKPAPNSEHRETFPEIFTFLSL